MPLFSNGSSSSAFSFQATTVTSPESSASANRKTLPLVWSCRVNVDEGKISFTLPANCTCNCVLVISPHFVEKRLMKGKPASSTSCGLTSTLLFAPKCSSVWPLRSSRVYAWLKLAICPALNSPDSIKLVLSFHSITRSKPALSTISRLAYLPDCFPSKLLTGKIATMRPETVTSFSLGTSKLIDKQQL